MNKSNLPQGEKSKLNNSTNIHQGSRKAFIPSHLFNPKKYISKNLKEQDVIDLKLVFDILDEEETGILAPNQIQYILIQNGFATNRDTIYEMIGEFSENESGGLEFQDFINLMNRRPKFNEKESDIKKLYKKYDKKNKGFIEFQDIKQVNKQLKQEMSDQEINEMIKQVGGGTGIITYKEFETAMLADVYNDEYVKVKEEEKKKKQKQISQRDEIKEIELKLPMGDDSWLLNNNMQKSISTIPRKQTNLDLSSIKN